MSRMRGLRTLAWVVVVLATSIGAAAASQRDQELDGLFVLLKKAPTTAEAESKRATVYYMMGDFAASVADIERTLALEPRHFGALSGLGLIYAHLGKEEAAVRAFKAALKINPHLPGATAYIEAIHKKETGQAI